MKRENNCRRFFTSIVVVMLVLAATSKVMNVSETKINDTQSNSVGDAFSDEKSKSHTLKAVLYQNSKYSSGGKGVSLTTDSSAKMTDWEEGGIRYLQVDVKLHELKQGAHTVRIVLPKEFYFDGDINYKPVGCTDVSFHKNPSISVNSGGSTYSCEKTSGTLTYYIGQNIGQTTIQIPIAYDSKFWDKQSNSALTDSSTIPITVTLNYEDKKGVYDSRGELHKLKLSKATSGKGTQRRGFYPMYSNRYDLSVTNTKDLEFELLETNQKFETTYLKEGTIEISIPYYQDNSGKKHYLKYDYNKIQWYKEFFFGGMNFDIQEKSESKIKIKLNNLMFNTRDLFILPLTYPESIKTSAKYITFTKGHFKISGTSNNGSKVTMIDEDMDNFEYPTSYKEDFIYHIYDEKQLHYYTGRDAVSFLGGIYFENIGLKETGRKTFTFEFPKETLVTTINLPSSSPNQYYNVEYTLVDENHNRITIDGKNKWYVKIKNSIYGYPGWIHNTFTTFSRQDLPEAHRKYFFKTIKHTVDTFVAGGKCLLYTAEYDNTGTGNYYGYQSKFMKSNSRYSMRVIVESDNGVPKIDVNVPKSVTTNYTSAMGIDSARFDTNRTFAGCDIQLEGSFFVNAYPYGTSQRIEILRIGLLLPDGMSLNKDDVILTLKNGNSVKVKSVTSKAAKSGHKYWIVESDKIAIGYCSERLGEIASGARVDFKIKMATATNMQMTTLSTFNILSCSGYQVINDSFGNWGWTRQVDTYDLNGNGRTNDHIAKINIQNDSQCVIDTGKADIELKSSLEISGNGSGGGTGVKIKSASNVVTYSLELKSKADNFDTGLKYYIPIPKRTSVLDTKMVTGQAGKLFDLTLTGSASEVGSNLKSIEYATKTGLTYTSANSLSENDWYTKAEMSSRGISYGDVTMIRVVVKDGALKKGMTSTLNINLQTKATDLTTIRSYKNIWMCSGYFSFQKEGLNIGGWLSSNEVSVTVDSAPVSIDPSAPGVDEDDVKESLVYENDIEVLDKETVEFTVNTNIGEERTLTFTLKDKSGSTVSPSNFVLKTAGGSTVSSSGSSFTILENTKYVIHFNDNYLKNIKTGIKDFILYTKIDYWEWEYRWEWETRWEEGDYWDSVEERWVTTWYSYQVQVQRRYKKYLDTSDSQDARVIKRKLFIQH
ncbi:MAG: hypothetical protein E7262_07830 [Lachnospiraceae bacterium]|nr:hypothetical protein [Lachnospiraceae bacterium]